MKVELGDRVKLNLVKIGRGIELLYFEQVRTWTHVNFQNQLAKGCVRVWWPVRSPWVKGGGSKWEYFQNRSWFYISCGHPNNAEKPQASLWFGCSTVQLHAQKSQQTEKNVEKHRNYLQRRAIKNYKLILKNGFAHSAYPWRFSGCDFLHENIKYSINIKWGVGWVQYLLLLIIRIILNHVQFEFSR